MADAYDADDDRLWRHVARWKTAVDAVSSAGAWNRPRILIVSSRLLDRVDRPEVRGRLAAQFDLIDHQIDLAR